MFFLSRLNPSIKFISHFKIVRTGLVKMAESSKPFIVEYAPQGRAKCKTCKQQIEKSSARIGKMVTNPFSDDGGLMKQWYHIKCIFDTLRRARATTAKINSTQDLEGFENMNEEDKKIIESFITGEALNTNKCSSPLKPSPAKRKKQATLTSTFSPSKGATSRMLSTDAGPSSFGGNTSCFEDNPSTSRASKDDSFREFRRLCTMLASEPSYNAKTKIISDFIKKGTSQDNYTGDLYLLAKLFLPAVNKRVYNLQSKQLVKLFSQILGCDHDDMITDLEKGDVAETISNYFEGNTKCKPLKKSILTNQEVDEFLDSLTMLSKEEEQIRELTKISRKCTPNDLKYIIRLIKHDLRMNTGAKHVLEAIHPSAYEAFQASNDLYDVIKRSCKKEEGMPSLNKKLSIRASVMTPVKPMLAEACKSFSQAIKKSPNGMYAEIKYDGERVQVHKSGDKFQFFSRSLKPVLPHKVSSFKEYLPKAFPHGNDLILDSEVLLVDNKTSTPLPFGTLGIHKKSAFKDANVCLFIFDCLQFNDQNLMNKTMQERRQYLEMNVTIIPNRIMLSETTLVKSENKLSKLMSRAMREGLEGLVLKDLQGIYEPGKRHWLKMKKDYLAEGSMADTADLVVLGAYYGTGNKGGLMSIFLMGVFNPHTKMWCTVAKCGNGHDDKTIDRLNKELKMKKISKDPNRVPTWLDIHRSLVPDFVIDDPKKAPVWEITGAEFSKSTVHTANGISIRFPRVTRIRDDKDWETATDLNHLQTLFKNSRVFTDSKKISEDINDEEDDDDSSDDDKSMKCEDVKSDSVLKKGKRKADDDIGGHEMAKKQVCKYGSKCYQTSTEHLKKYLHVTTEAQEQSCQLSEKLPSLFSGIQFYIPKETENVKKLKRYIIAYDGDVVSELFKETATYIIAKNEVQYQAEVPVVSPDWIWDCIKKRRIVPVKKYLSGLSV